MLEREISALEALIADLEKSALKNPPDRNIPFHFGKRIGERAGLHKALDAIKTIRDEAEKAHEIRR